MQQGPAPADQAMAPAPTASTPGEQVEATRAADATEPEAGQEPQPALRRRRRRILIGSAVAVVAVVGVTGGLYGTPLASKLGLAGPTTQAPSPPQSPQAALRPVGADGPAPTPQGVAAALQQVLANPALGTLTGRIVDPATGQVLWERDAGRPMTPASSNKIITAAAALLALDPNSRLTTKVVEGPEPGTIVLVGGGDPTLSLQPDGKESVYPGAAKLQDLVNKVKAAGVPVRKVLVDTSRYTADNWLSSWEKSDIVGGDITYVAPVMLDGGREDATNPESRRTDRPAVSAGRHLAQALDADLNSVAAGKAPANSKVIAEVRSPSIQQLVDNALLISDNVLAETLAREVARAKGKEPSFSGARQAVQEVLSQNGFDLTGWTMADGSGLSTENKVPARLLSDILAVAAAPDGSARADQRTPKLRPLLTGLPVAGGSGTLAGRYQNGNSAQGKGWVRAKTGTLTKVNSLSGIVLDADNRLLAFSLLSNGSDMEPGRAALDAVAATLRECGCQR
ncbi:D-alanyl-D-alanine carboxypeptidase/D-alanyl-D-alanine endopeptidase [Longimycelium tulufanense]|uniref:D-alanyl-D-alanine carboxypeptidase/D-alanyl-D-alanine endopeptidase n=1 Tax=Longimycelium tulufanense TaxID=907463 RepID=UPI001666C034|nr:D-alanyl-D-alanine carboxypeptidase/D-alanyl-D-alanine-endopeptidase [Longimycelium tulufanense]